MFKGFIPSKRPASNDLTFDMIDVQLAQGKENRPQGPQGVAPSNLPKTFINNAENTYITSTNATVQSPAMEMAFDKLLNDLQIPLTLRPKLNGMESSVKAAMLRSSQVLAIGSPLNPPAPKITPVVRRTRSSNSLNSPHSTSGFVNEFPVPPQTAGRASGLPLTPPSSLIGDESTAFLPPSAPFMDQKTTAPESYRQHSRGKSVDAPRSSPKMNAPVAARKGESGGLSGRSAKDKDKDISPTKFYGILTSTSSTKLDTEIVKKLRLLLRNESADWTEEFVHQGGYNALLTRLNEILEVEWREEQHDDQILYELLRCLKALTTSAVGCTAIRSCAPAPFPQLISLLYSDKKPGDLCTRQIMVELLLNLFDLYPSSSLPSMNSKPPTRRQEVWEEESSSSKLRRECDIIILPNPHKSLFSFTRNLLLTQAPPPSENPTTPIEPHEFIESLHIPRIYKTYLQELSDVCRDFFWVFCHPNNTIWNLDDTDEAKVEKPRAPGGMTGGVEFEAMSYLTTHFKFINAVARCVMGTNLPKDHEHSAYRFHADLFASGIERTLLISRKASTTYYPTLHLEIARYTTLATGAGYELPYAMSRLVGSPPSNMCKPGRSPKVQNSNEKKKTRGNKGDSQANIGSPSRSKDGQNRNHREGPKIPPPKQLEPIVW